MRPRWFRRALGAAGVTALVGAMAGVAAAPVGASALRHASAVTTPTAARTLAPNTRFFTPPPANGSLAQEAQLIVKRDLKDAAALGKVLATPQAVWFNGVNPQQAQETSPPPQTPAQATLEARLTMAEAALEHAVPVIVAYDIPGRDCAQYSAGGALSTAAYEAWVSGVAAGIGDAQAVVILEPDALGNMPSDCLASNPVLNSTNYPFTDQERISELYYAVQAFEADPNTLVYLDGTHSAWQNVGNIAQRLVEAGVQQAQGFFLNVSNYQYTSNDIAYGTWISDCIAYAAKSGDIDTATSTVVPGTYSSEDSFFSSSCPDQYWNGGPPSWTGVALSPYGVWSTTTTTEDLNISGENTRYASDLGSTVPTTHFVIDTSRNGDGPNDMAAYAAAPYDQPASVITTLQAGNWCNPPAAGIGLAPTASTGVPLVDAYLWVKTVGESDGECDAAGGVRAWDYSIYNPWNVPASAQGTFDPLWGMVDPAAGDWFPQQALQLIQDADQSPSAPGNEQPS